MKIGFYGGMANNTYVVAKRLSEAGVNVVFIRDRMDHYGISQPSWEDAAFDMSYEQLNATSSWSPVDWTRFESDIGWVAPTWLVDPIIEGAVSIPKALPVRMGEMEKQYLQMLPPLDHAGRILYEMQACDCLFVSSTHALILALASGRPYFICPAGGEFMIAAGLYPGQGSVAQTLRVQGSLLRLAFRRAQAVVTHTPFLLHKPLVGSYWRLLRDYGRVRFSDLSMPYVPVAALAPAQKRDSLNALLDSARAKTISTRFTVFVPSRIDYRWKGQDRILAALSRMKHRSAFTFVFSGWGVDYLDFKSRTANMDNVRLLSYAVSKPRLYAYFQGSDLVVDQFTLGHYGTSTREAISVGTPVMTWVNQSVTRLSRTWRPAPIIQARDPVSIAFALDNIADGNIDLTQRSIDGLTWTREHASSTNLRDGLAALMPSN